MKKSFFLLVPAAFGLLMMSACSDDSSAAASNSNQSSCALNPSETGLEINCNGESYGFLKTSSKGVYGSCGAEALKDDSGYKLVCGGDSVGVVYNGIRGRNGENGTNGLPGPKGEDGVGVKGDPGAKGADGSSCYAEKVATGFDLYCADEKVGTILNGAKGATGYSCSVTSSTLAGTATISCEDGTEATVSNGTKGLAGENCEVTRDLLSVEEDEDSPFYGQTYVEITCDGEKVKVYDGVKGANGSSCSVVKNTKTGIATITCGDDEVEIKDGANGADGKSCSMVTNALAGTSTITCETGDEEEPTVSFTVKNGTNGTDGKSCSVSKEDGVVTISCETGDEEEPTVSYTVKDGTNGTNGFSCESVDNGNGSVTIKCQDGVNAETGDPTYTETVILAAGYAYCGTGAAKKIYNTLTQSCNSTTGDVTNFNCGSAVIDDETEFCYAGTIVVEKCGKKTFDYVNQYCDKTDAENPIVKNIYAGCELESGVRLYDTRVQFCTDVTMSGNYGIYDLCGGQEYAPSTHFCVGTTTYDLETYGPCGDTYYTKASQTCEDGVPTNIPEP